MFFRAVCCYAAAANRFLRQRVSDYEPGKHWGGTLFLFLRGMTGPDTAGESIHFDRQSPELINAVDQWLGGVDESA